VPLVTGNFSSRAITHLAELVEHFHAGLRTLYNFASSRYRHPGQIVASEMATIRPRRVAQALALALSDILPSATQTASAPRISFLSRLNGWPARSPADASPTPSRMPAHGSGPMWIFGQSCQ
jgi:hypothetical protein